MKEKFFEASFESLHNYECPSWFKNAKFGIWSHWGPQSVPMCGDWYARNMYIQDTSQYNYHLRTYGHPSKFGYKDICKLWKAEKFDPEGLMKLYHKAGARYFVAQAMHHDNFFNYPSQYNKMNSQNIGPHKDICGLWKKAAEKNNMRFGLTEHLAASFSWWKTNKGCDTYGPYKGIPYDGNDPEYSFFYHMNQEHLKEKDSPWYTTNYEFQQYWLNVMKELITKYEPDLLYSDGGLPFGNDNGSCHSNDVKKADILNSQYKIGLEAVSFLYNTSIKKNGVNEAVYNQKDRRKEIYTIGLLDVEKSQLPNILEYPWQTDSCLGNWFYDKQQSYKTAKQVVEMLVDIIAKNGSLLLNVLQKPDGTIDEQQEFILNELSEWFAVCNEAVYETHPWVKSGEGISHVKIEDNNFNEETVDWTNEDYRFTAKDNNIYAFMLNPDAGGTAVLKSFVNIPVKNIELLGYGPLEFSQDYGIIIAKLPDKLPAKFVNCLKIS